MEVLDVNPQYAHVKLPSGNESTVSIRDLAPCADSPPVNVRSQQAVNTPSGDHRTDSPSVEDVEPVLSPEVTRPSVVEEGEDTTSALPQAEPEPVLRRSTRTSNAPARLIDEM